MQQRPLVPLFVLLLIGLAAVPVAGFSSGIGIQPRTPRDRHTTMSMSAAATTVDCGVIIAGAGPAGLCCALALARRGLSDIHVVERNPSSEFFEVDKAYLYRIDGRGQRLTGLLGITERLQEVSVRTEEFVNVTVVTPDGGVKVVPAPVDPTQQTAYWLPRRALIKFLVDQIAKEGYTSQIKFHWGIAVEAFLPPEGDPQAPTAQAVLRGRALGAGDCGVEGVKEGEVIEFRSQRVLGCDGMNSRVRSGLEAWAAVQDQQQPQQDTKGKKHKHKRFALRYVESPSAGLRYKILTLEDGFPLTAAQPSNITEKSTCYSYVGVPPKRKLFGRFRPPLRLGLLPYKMQGIPRTANIITQPDAEVFGLKTGPEVLAFLQRQLPQCAVDRMVSPQEAERFAQSPGGLFPRPQYALEAQQVLAGGKGGVVLLGDAIHAFPPDLGAGVNSAFEDVLDWIYSLDRADGNWGEALPYYEQLRAPQSRAICELIPIGFPHQYNHMHPLSKALKLAGVAARTGLHKLFPFLFAPPVFFMVQDPRLDFAVVLKRATRTTRLLQAIGAVLFTAVAGKMGWFARPDEKARAAWAAVVGAWAKVCGGKGSGAVGPAA